MIASPSSLRLAEGSRATLRVPCAREQPVLTANVGRIDALQEIGSGIYQAEYVPPDSLDPQVAIVAARCADAFGWVPIALSGIRDVVVAARHGTPVSVAVGEAQFGPVPADATGRALVRVVVPPGARFASYRNQRIDLGVAPRPLVHVVLDLPGLDANVSGVTGVRALTVDERGAPLARAPIALSVSEGTLSPAVEREPGLVEARWELSPGRVREATVTARLGTRVGSIATAALYRVAGPARTVALEVSPDTMVAGEGDELTVAAVALDAGGNPSDAPVALVARPGTVLEWERVGTGRYVGRVQVPSRRAGRQELELEVVASGALKARRVVPLLPGPAKQVRVEPRDELIADGREREIRVSVLDANENRVDVELAPVVTAAHGDLGDPARYAPGAYRVAYRAPLAARDFTDVVRVSVGPVEGAATLHVRAVGGGIVLAPKLGFTAGPGGLRSLAGGGEVGFWLSSPRGLGLVLEARAFTFGRTDTVQELRVRSEARFLALEASLAWRRPRWGGMGWLGAGGGAVGSSATVSASGQPDLTDRSWVPAAHASAGWGWPFGPGIPFGELKLGWQGDPDRGPLRGSLRSLTFSVGYRFDVL